MSQSTTYEVDGGRIRVHRAQHFLYWSWVDERGRRLSDYRSGYLSHQDCISDAERETSAIALGRSALADRDNAEPEALPWWVET
jgi:hypothetical protein